MRVLRTRCSFTMISRWLRARCVFAENWDRAINKTAVISASICMRSSSFSSPAIASSLPSIHRRGLDTFQTKIVLFLHSSQPFPSHTKQCFCDSSFLFCYHSNGIICCNWTAAACVCVRLQYDDDDDFYFCFSFFSYLCFTVHKRTLYTSMEMFNWMYDEVKFNRC